MINIETKYSEQASSALAEFGISFKEASTQDIFRITSRDTEDGTYPYNAGFTKDGQVRHDYLMLQGGLETGFYYTGLWEYPQNSHKIGEVGMIHISPALRGRGLASLLKILGSVQLIEQGARVLRSVVGDETGKVLGLNQKLKFQDSGQKFGIDKTSIWQLEIDDPSVKLDFFYKQFQERFHSLAFQDLSFRPEEVDIDNPLRVFSVPEVVLQRLKVRKMREDGSTLLFGYHHAPLMLWKQAYRDRTADLNLRVLNNHPQAKVNLEESLNKFFLEAPEIYSPYAGNKFLQVSTEYLEIEEEIRTNAVKLALAGQDYTRNQFIPMITKIGLDIDQ